MGGYAVVVVGCCCCCCCWLLLLVVLLLFVVVAVAVFVAVLGASAVLAELGRCLTPRKSPKAVLTVHSFLAT